MHIVRKRGKNEETIFQDSNLRLSDLKAAIIAPTLQCCSFVFFLLFVFIHNTKYYNITMINFAGLNLFALFYFIFSYYIKLLI